MAKISDRERQGYFEKVKAYHTAAAVCLDSEKNIRAEIADDPAEAALKRLVMVNEMLNLTSNYMIINGVSQSVLQVKNEDALNNGRKSLYRGLIYFEELVSGKIDAPFSEYEEKLVEIESVSAVRRYFLVRKMGLAIQLLENAYGYNTKWKWAFVELEGRYAAVSKNIIDLRGAVMNTDPRSPDYEPTVYHLRLIKRLLMQAADRYREQYELSTNRINDFRQGIAFLSALRRLHIVLGDRTGAETVKKKLDIWTVKLEADVRKQAGGQYTKNSIPV